MDILAGVNREWLAALTWLAALCAGVAVLLWRRRRSDLAALAAVVVFAAVNVGAGIYVLNHLADGRWGGDAHARLDPPSLSGAPVVGQFLQPLDAAMADLAGRANDFIDFQTALPVALGFFAAAGWALAVLVPVGLWAAAGRPRPPPCSTRWKNYGLNWTRSNATWGTATSFETDSTAARDRG